MHRTSKKSKPMMGAIMTGIGITAIAGIMGAQKMKKSRRTMNTMMAMKDEFASEAGMIARKTGNTLIKAGKAMNRWSR